MGVKQVKVNVKNPFKDQRSEPTADLTIDVVEVLKRYDNMFRALVLRGVKMGGFTTKPFTLLEREFTELDIRKNIRHSVLYFSVSHAFQGKDYIGDIMTNMQYTILQAALILTITITLYISPPSMDEDYQTWFSILVGFAAMCHLGCIITCTILCAVLNATFTEVDGTIIYIECHRIVVSVTVFNYLANVCAMASMIVAGYSRTFTEGYIQLAYSIVTIIVLILILKRAGYRVLKNQDIRAYRFYKQYCDIDGQLKDEYLDLIYPPEDKKSI